ncbi:serine/threonine-protein kinase [Streptomyces sp. NPDC059582]|uniref:serine/threonine-protein kinase n=1 Tax=Streptomyces sp. NPDC059582 TaxID=3346875 RepID=UPI003694607E
MSTGGSGRRVVDGRFELVERLGGGGMGWVWRAHDLALQRDVAVKEVRPPDPALAEYDPEGARTLRERVLREARALARLHHPNVVTIHHIVDGGPDTYPWIVMELVTGGSLQERLDRGVMTPGEAARFGRELLAALRAAHAVGIEHRDVKPANVLLRPDGRPVLTDFGIAAVRESVNLTATGAVIGSPDYMAPERVGGKEGGPASDLWSLAMLLYVALEGHHPLRRASTLATLAAVLSEDVPAPLRAGPLTGVLTAVLVRDPQARPDAETVDRMLAEATSDEPVPPPPHASGTTSYRPPAPPPASATTSYRLAPPPGAGPTVTPDGRPPHRTRRTAAIAAAAAGTVLTGVLVWTLLPSGDRDSGGTPDSSTSTSASASQSTSAHTSTRPTSPSAQATQDAKETTSLLTPAGIRRTVAKLEAVSGDTKVTRFVLYEEYAIAEAPVAGHPELYDRYSYRGGDVAVKDGPGGTVTSGMVPVDLDAFEWDTVPALLRKAHDTLNVPSPTSRYLIVSPVSSVSDTEPTMSVYLSDDYGGGYIKANVHGEVIATYPRGD